MWFDLLWGWCLLGLGETGDVEWLARAAIAADRLNSPAVSDMALRLLALAFDRYGYTKEAQVLADYVERNLRAIPRPVPGTAVGRRTARDGAGLRVDHGRDRATSAARL